MSNREPALAGARQLCGACGSTNIGPQTDCLVCGTPLMAPPGGAAWAPTHCVPAEGTAAWAEPDPSLAPAAWLPGSLPVQLAEECDDWALVVCDNGWSGWVDGRLLLRG